MFWVFFSFHRFIWTFLNLSVLFSFRTSCTSEFYSSIFLCEMPFFISHVTITFAIYLMNWESVNSQSMCPYSSLLVSFFQSLVFFPRQRDLDFLISSQAEVVTMVFIILLLLSAIFPTLTMLLMCSQNSMQLLLDLSCVPVSSVLIVCVLDWFFSQCVLLHSCQPLMSSTTLSLNIWHWDDSLQLLIYDICTTRKFCNPPAFPESMLSYVVSSAPPFIMQFHCSMPLSFCFNP